MKKWTLKLNYLIERKLLITHDRVWSDLLGTKFLKYFESPVVDSAACSRATHFLAFPIHLYKAVTRRHVLCHIHLLLYSSSSSYSLSSPIDPSRMSKYSPWSRLSSIIPALFSFGFFGLGQGFSSGLQTGFFHCEFRFSCFASAFSTFPC
jgi:hypothetical protein